MREFIEAVEQHDVDALLDLMADDVEFRSPVVFKQYTGREAVGHILRAVMQVFEDFRYVNTLSNDRGGHALVFEANVGDRSLEGCDFIETDADGRISRFTVMVRPLSAAHALAAAMSARLDADAAPRGA